jgi:hypothetical protein
LRKALLRRLPLKRRDLYPSARMADLVPKASRGSLVRGLSAEFRTDPLPALVRPRWLVAVLVVPCLAVGGGVIAALLKTLLSLSWATVGFIGVVTALVASCLASMATRPFRTEFLPRAATVGDLSRSLVAHKTDLASPTPGRWTREQAAERVREIVIEQLDCAGTYREDVSFINDLGLT